MIYHWYTEINVNKKAIHSFFSDDLRPTVSHYEAGRDEKCTFTLPLKNMQFILVHLHVLWHRRIWWKLSAGKRQESNIENSPEQDKAAGYYNWQWHPRDGERWRWLHVNVGSAVGRAGFQTTWSATPGGGSAVKGQKSFTAVKTAITMQRASSREKNWNLNNGDECWCRLAAMNPKYELRAESGWAEDTVEGMSMVFTQQ